MLFYLIMGGLFTLYGLDLLGLVVISAIARAAELRAALRVKRERKRAAKAKVEKEQAGLGDAVPKPQTFAFGNAESMLKPAALPTTRPLGIKTQHPDAATGPQSTSPQSPVSTPVAPPCPEPQQRLANTMSNLSVLMDMHSSPSLSPAGAPDDTPYPGSPTADHANTVMACNPLYQTTAPASSEESFTSGNPVAQNHPFAAAAGEASPADVSPARTPSPITPSSIMQKALSPTMALAMAAGDSMLKTSPSAPPLALDKAPSPMTPLETQLSGAPSGMTSVTTGGASNTGAKPYGWGFGSGIPPPGVVRGPPLASSGGSVMSLYSSGGSGVTTDMVVNAEIVLPTVHEGKRPPPRSYKDGVELPKRVEGAQCNYSDVVWPLPVEDYPLVLIQVPMYNEEAHAALIVERCCAIAWPRSRVLIQVLDDSTKAHIREKVDAAAVACMEAGHPVQVLRRTNRQGYKAGAMVAGLEHVAGMGFKYCAIFDADFEPPEDFLLEAVGPLEADGELGFVQTRWLNPYKSFLTWAQNINLGFHFDVEQRSRSYMGWFFNFNGTAGVWRIQAISEAGGWETDTVVEDMDLSLRAYLAGWRGLYLPHVGCVNEVPDDLSTYKTQQYRWLCGPMQILSKAFLTIWRAKKVPLRLRLNCYWFFARYVLFAIITLAVLVVPPVALWLDPWHWHWPEIFFCASINFALAVYLYITPWSIAYMLFSVATGYFKAWAMLGGLFGSKKSKSWKVTAKKGAQDEGDKSLWQKTKDVFCNIGTPYALEMCLSVYYAAIAVLAFLGVGLSGPSWLMGAYCSLMTLIFFFISFGDAFL